MAKNEQFDYAAKVAALDAIIAQLQQNDTPIDEAIRLHDEGKKLVAELNEYLETAEVTIRTIKTESD